MYHFVDNGVGRGRAGWSVVGVAVQVPTRSAPPRGDRCSVSGVAPTLQMCRRPGVARFEHGGGVRVAAVCGTAQAALVASLLLLPLPVAGTWPRRGGGGSGPPAGACAAAGSQRRGGTGRGVVGGIVQAGRSAGRQRSPLPLSVSLAAVEGYASVPPLGHMAPTCRSAASSCKRGGSVVCEGGGVRAARQGGDRPAWRVAHACRGTRAGPRGE